MNTLNILNRQIANQITGTTIVCVHFQDTGPGYLELIEQDDHRWIRPAFCEPKQITQELIDELKSKFQTNKKFNTDPEVIRSGMKYDEFYDRYYNSI